MDLSIMFFGTESSLSPADHYDDVLAIAKAADELGFTALWTPERHFQNFGHIFPSPAVLGAALAVSTERIDIRAGSIVLPLHHPIRVVEEWSVIDNLSRGRIGLSIATGWHSKDFVLAPDRYADRRSTVPRDVALLRRLWSGDPVSFPDGTGEHVELRTRPVPVTPQLPLWLTTSGSPETWTTAASLGMGILAPASAATRGELAGRIDSYRRAFVRAEASGSPAPHAQGVVTLMMHAYVGESDSAVRSAVREPLDAYLRSFLQQTSNDKGFAPDAGLAGLSQADQRRVVDFAFERHLAGSALLGSPSTCLRNMADLRDTGVDEIACFVDFGLPREKVLASLSRLADLRSHVS